MKNKRSISLKTVGFMALLAVVFSVSSCYVAPTPPQYDTDLVIREGRYEGSKAIDIIIESQEWVESRIFSAIRSAGLDPMEERNAVTFEKRPPIDPSFLGSIYKRSEPE